MARLIGEFLQLLVTQVPTIGKGNFEIMFPSLNLAKSKKQV
jgi:hypothetical protein